MLSGLEGKDTGDTQGPPPPGSLQDVPRPTRAGAAPGAEVGLRAPSFGLKPPLPALRANLPRGSTDASMCHRDVISVFYQLFETTKMLHEDRVTV